MAEMWNMDSVEYLILEIKMLNKYGFRIRLYDTGIRRMQNR